MNCLDKYSDDNSQYDFLKLRQEVIQKDQMLLDNETKIKSLEDVVEKQKEEVTNKKCFSAYL